MSEEQIYEYWKSNQIFSKTIEANSDKPTYVFYDGPPFMTGTPHYGHICAGFIKDTVLRFYHEKGYNVPRFAGSDNHGLPIEFEIEKELGIKTTQQVLDFGIANYNEHCRGIVLKYSDIWEETMGRLGRWIDFKNDYKTMTKEFMNSVWWVFSELYKKNRVYEGVKIMPYSTSCATPLSNFETQQNHKDIQDDSLFIRLPVHLDGLGLNQESSSQPSPESNIWILVWTTTPWTLPSNYALCVNPTLVYDLVLFQDQKYIVAHELIENVFKKGNVEILKSFQGIELIGAKYTPVFKLNDQIPESEYKIIAGEFVTDKDGTGIVHIAPAYGLDDYEVCLKNNLIQKDSKLFQPLDPNGFVNLSSNLQTESDEQFKEIQGMFYKNHTDKTSIDLNTWVVIQLKKSGYYLEKRQFVHSYPFCWRSDTPLIYRAVSSWFVKVEDLRERLVELNEQINWIPGHVGAARFSTWLASAKDWGVSRSRFWGTPIPIWKSPDGDIICPSSSYELEQLAGMEPGSITDLHRHFIDSIKIHANGKEYTRIPDIFDCWFESGSMPYGSINLNGIVELLRNSDSGIQLDVDSNPYVKTRDNKIHKILPADFIAEGLDQTRGWFYTLLVLSTSLFDTIPFKNVIVNGLVLAEDGKKMSKKLKNYPDPMKIVETYGSDCIRLYLLGSPIVRAEPLKFSEKGVRDQMKDIIIPLTNSIVFWKEYVKLYFCSHNSNPIYLIEDNLESVTNPINLWALKQYKNIEDDFVDSMTKYDLNRAVSVLPRLVEILNNGYIKFGRLILKGKETQTEWSQSLSVMFYLIKRIIISFRSIIPFFTESKYLELVQFSKEIGFDEMIWNIESIHLIETVDNYIEFSQEQINLANDFNIIYNMIQGIYQIRGTNNISLKKPIKNVKIAVDSIIETKYSSNYKNYKNFVLDECNILKLDFVDQQAVNIQKQIIPVKSLIFKKFGKAVGPVFEELIKMNTEQLETILDEKKYKDFEIDNTLFNFNYSISVNGSVESHEDEQIESTGQIESSEINPTNPNLTFKQIKFENSNIIVVANLDYDESVDKLFYYRVVATQIQKARKEAGLHPWDPATSYYSGDTKYPLDTQEARQFIQNITRINFEKYEGQEHMFSTKPDESDFILYLKLN